jgi:hypothetical protein
MISNKKIIAKNSLWINVQAQVACLNVNSGIFDVGGYRSDAAYRPLHHICPAGTISTGP